MRLFTIPFGEYEARKVAAIRSAISSEPQDYIVNVDRDEYIKHLVKEHALKPVSVDVESTVIAGQSEKPVSLPDMWGEIHETKRNEYEFEMSYEGDSASLVIKPNPSRMWNCEVDLGAETIKFRIKDWNNNPEQVKADLNSWKGNIAHDIEHLNKNIAAYNAQLPGTIRGFFDNRKMEIEKNHQDLISIGVPVKKQDIIPETYAVPLENRQKRVVIASTTTESKPAQGKPSLPDPTLADSIYKDILETIHGVGKVMERLPKLYTDRDENSLRDLFLLYLEPRYTSAGGETFNGQGKTDILIRHENSNVFIAEFKFWEGAKLFNEALEQLYGYLTWRDSKAALVIFNKNKNHTAVVAEIKSAVEAHSTYSETNELVDDTWLNYVMHFPGDRKRHIKLAVQIFHLK